MKNCDPKGPVMVYISKMVPEGGRFHAFGRIFSGTIVAGQKIKILGANYKPGTKTDIYEANIQRVTVAMGKNFEPIGEVPCGNTLALSGIDEFILKTGTLVST
jgi:elongation factor 2